MPNTDRPTTHTAHPHTFHTYIPIAPLQYVYTPTMVTHIAYLITQYVHRPIRRRASRSVVRLFATHTVLTMPAALPVVSVQNGNGATCALPEVFLSPIRPDIVNAVHTGLNKNNRQGYAVDKRAGHQTAAESWGTGRAVSRIPRVPGGGTHRAGQGAFGNMCRGGRMFAPTKVGFDLCVADRSRVRALCVREPMGSRAFACARVGDDGDDGVDG